MGSRAELYPLPLTTASVMENKIYSVATNNDVTPRGTELINDRSLCEVTPEIIHLGPTSADICLRMTGPSPETSPNVFTIDLEA